MERDGDDIIIETKDLVSYIIDLTCCDKKTQYSKKDKQVIKRFLTDFFGENDDLMDYMLADKDYERDVIDFCLTNSDDEYDEPSTEELCEQEYKNNVMNKI